MARIQRGSTMELTTFELITLNTLKVYGAHQIRQFNWLCIYLNHKLAFIFDLAITLVSIHSRWTAIILSIDNFQAIGIEFVVFVRI